MVGDQIILTDAASRYATQRTGFSKRELDGMQALNQLRSAESAILSRSDFSRRTGSSFSGKRDLNEVLGYKRVLRVEDFWLRFRRNGIARRLVKAFPDATWRGQGELIEDEDPQHVTDFEAAWFALDDKFKLWQAFHHADVLGGLGHFGVVLLGAAGDSAMELKANSPLLFVTAFGPMSVMVKEYEDDISNERYGQPRMYTIKESAPGDTSIRGGRDRDVHWTRIIHVAEGIESKVLQTPRLEPVWNDFDDLEKVRGAGAEAFWQRVNRGMAFNLDPTIPMGEPDMETWKDEIDKYQHGLSRFMRLRGVDVQEFGSDVATYDRNIASHISLIASGGEIPQRILLGSERGQLASEQDGDNWDQRVQDRRDEWAAPSVVSQFATRAMAYGWLPPSEEYEIRWPAMHEYSDEQKADYAKRLAEVNHSNGKLVVTSDEIRDWAFGADPLEQDVLDEEAELARQKAMANPLLQQDQPTAARKSKRATWRASRKKTHGKK